LDLVAWLREQCAEFSFDVRGIFRRSSPSSTWPLVAADSDELEDKLAEGGHLLALPKEPAALANVLEVTVVDFLLARLGALGGAEAQRGTERGYPDLEISGPAFGGSYHALDVKAARLAKTHGRQRTQSRITLYTGNTYFQWPDLHWPGTPRPFSDYRTHLDLLMLYRFMPETTARLGDLELIVQESWRIGSRQRSSTTREYIGAVDGVEQLRHGEGEFDTPEAFYDYWRKYPFDVSVQVQKRLHRLVQQQSEEIARLRRDQGDAEE
jgi:hypothetical protein